MSYETWSPDTAASQAGSVNGSLDGLNVGEGCPAGNMNAAVRMVMANIRAFWNVVNNPESLIYAALMPKSGGAFVGDITRDGAGGYAHHASSTYLSFKVHTTAFGASQPAGMAVGDWWVELEA